MKDTSNWNWLYIDELHYNAFKGEGEVKLILTILLLVHLTYKNVLILESVLCLNINPKQYLPLK